MPLLSQFAHDVGEALALDAAAGLPPAQEGGAAVGEAHALVPLNIVSYHYHAPVSTSHQKLP